MEASRIAGDSGPEGDIAKESRKVKVEACPVEISVTLGWAVFEGWREQEHDCSVKRHEGERVNADQSLSPWVQCLSSPDRSSSSPGLFSPILILHFPNWSSYDKLAWDTSLCMFSYTSFLLKCGPGLDAALQLTWPGPSMLGLYYLFIYFWYCKLRVSEFIVSRVIMLDSIKTAHL